MIIYRREGGGPGEPGTLLPTDQSVYGPYYADCEDWCETGSPDDHFVCTRERDHTGIHVGHYGPGEADTEPNNEVPLVCAIWQEIPEYLQLPRGL